MNSTFIIAEAGVNHDGSLDRAMELVEVASAAGADAVKFQTFRADQLVTKAAPKARYQTRQMGSRESHFKMIKRLELSADDHQGISDRCRALGIAFMSTPFDPSSVQYLVENFEMPFLKISSGDLTNPVMLMAAARSGLSVVLSTGMSDLDEVKSALGVLAYALSRSSTAPSGRSEFAAAFDTDDARARLKKKVILLHCTTEYPAPIKDVNLRVMQTMRDTFAVPVGYSDHTIGTNVPIAAAALGAAVVEKHFTLDRTLPGPDHAASLEPDELKSMVSGIREVNQAMGSPEKSVAKSEEENLSVARKSLVAASPIRAGEPLTEQNLTIKRPGNGVSPMEYFDRLGSTADRDYEAEDLIH